MRPRGMGLLEVVVALALLALAVLGAVAVVAQARVVPSLVQREAAARQIALDMMGRVQANPAGFRQGLYDAPLAPDSLSSSADSTAPLATTCGSATCSASQRAAADLSELATSLAQHLPGATLRLERSTTAGAPSGRVLIEWLMPRNTWMAAFEGTGCTAHSQCLRMEFAP